MNNPFIDYALTSFVVGLLFWVVTKDVNKGMAAMWITFATMSIIYIWSHRK